jgi:hypothetical protein
VEFDPGVHKFKAEMPGRPPLEQTVVLREGEKNRVIRLDFTPPAARPGHVVSLPRPVPASVYVVGGIAVAFAGAGATMGVLALGKKNDLTTPPNGCSPFCTSSDVSSTRTLAMLADIGFGAAIISAGVATYLLVTRPAVQPKGKEGQPPVEVEPSALLGPGYEGVGLRGSF